MCGGADNNKPPCIHTPLQKESTASVSQRTRCAGPVLFADWSGSVRGRSAGTAFQLHLLSLYVWVCFW